MGSSDHNLISVTNSIRLEKSMRNPWTELPLQPPYVLESDRLMLQGFNAGAAERHRFDLSLFPEPYFGSIAAPVVILNLNPGKSPDDAAVHADPTFAAMTHRSLNHELEPYPFLHLQPDANTPGSKWWGQRTRELVSDVGFTQVARQLGCVQYYPYHSSEYTKSTPEVPSQQYGFFLVRQAIERGAEIIIMRSIKKWLAAVPELAYYNKVHYGVNPRAPFISKGNLRSSYNKIVERIRRGE